MRCVRYLMLSGFMLVFSGALNAKETPIFRSKSADGRVVFSDAPLSNGRLARTSYHNQYGRPAATQSCTNVTKPTLQARVQKIESHIRSAASKSQMDVALLKAIAQVESCFDPMALSSVGAQGLMQLMPATARSLGVSNSYHIQQNLDGGAIYIANMLKRYNNNLSLALAAYNAGPSAVDKYNGIPPYPETQAYVKKVLHLYR